METSTNTQFEQNYQSHLKHLKLKGLQPKTIEAYSRAVRRAGDRFLRKPWVAPDLIKPPKTQRLPDIVTVAECRRLLAATRVVSYRVFFFTLYSLGLRLGEGLRLRVGDIDAPRRRVHIRDAKGNRDRFVPLPQATHQLLQRFWQVHRNPVLLFPSRHGGLKCAASAATHMDRGGVQRTLRQVVLACRLKKISALTACATAMPLT